MGDPVAVQHTPVLLQGKAEGRAATQDETQTQHAAPRSMAWRAHSPEGGAWLLQLPSVISWRVRACTGHAIAAGATHTWLPVPQFTMILNLSPDTHTASSGCSRPAGRAGMEGVAQQASVWALGFSLRPTPATAHHFPGWTLGHLQGPRLSLGQHNT